MTVEPQRLPERLNAVLIELGLEMEPEHFELAFMHRSYAYEHGGLPTNERLEFLGDAVLGLVVTDHLYTSHPDLSEGQLAKLRAAVVNSRALAGVARGLDLGAAVRLGKGEVSTGGRDKTSILADTTEAFIGAVFMTHGITGADSFVHHLFDPLMAEAATIGAGLDWKTSLQEHASSHGLGVPHYAVVEDGPDHAKSFEARVTIADRAFGPGLGRNKKQAEQQAAELAFAALQTEAAAEDAVAAQDAAADSVAADSVGAVADSTPAPDSIDGARTS